MRFCLDDDDVLELAGSAVRDRGATTGGRWTSSGPRTVSTGCSTSSRPAPRRSSPSGRPSMLEPYVLDRPGRGRDRGPVGRRADRRRARSGVIEGRHRAGRGSAPGEVLVADTTDARLGAGDEDGGGHRHQPGRPDLPRGHRRPGARHPGRGRDGGRHHAWCRTASRGHGVVRRGRHRSRLRRARSPSTSSETEVGDLPAPGHPDHDQPGQPGSSPSRRRSSPTTGSAWPGWSSSSASRSGSIRWPSLHPDRVRDPAARADLERS